MEPEHLNHLGTITECIGFCRGSMARCKACLSEQSEGWPFPQHDWFEFQLLSTPRRGVTNKNHGEEIGEELKASGLVTAWSEARPGEPGYADEDGVPVYREPGPQRHTYVVLELRPQRSSRARRNAQQKSGRARADSRAAGRALLLSSDAYLQLAGRVAVWREQVVRVMEADAQEAKAEANARQKERVAAILAGTDAAGAGAGVEEALNCWEEGAYEAETLEALAEFGD
ncbi:hypothetical protein EMIHUDRAFT_197062 [Emiliania huxleyi CCMP1516]|uniref:Uncharacterized protein n=2 Tax=Emiliania huxleyi TaxID=2903 RepID=A0A0D3ITM5_EMIH1|nr:hypothetical protein EMIHUDRAFT_197062 [Emiliania huxleyi CCMP1516]EOD14610.1 hypothetical protein EMIHUDRAFT_197062 [Emiliania huxleyi CCMP1516]|eukprot:XP_005767039.1 hypothetical protein EMIHUDRAFT_197062 [Emiliania huxleyi CCMP1516]